MVMAGELSTHCPRCEHHVHIDLAGYTAVSVNLVRHELSITVTPIVIHHDCSPPTYWEVTAR